MGIAVGIDLGTTFSAIARINEYDKPEVIKNREDKPLTPSVVAVYRSPPVVGDEAKELQRIGEEGVAAFFKRAMGDSSWRFDAETGSYTPTDLSALVVRKLKADAEARLGEAITDAVITVPAYFNNDQREATKAAGEAADLNVLMVINEPTAAALAFGLGGGAMLGKILIYDLGGGTFDVTLTELTKKHVTVLATEGDHELGGKNWDDRLANYLSSEFYEEHGENPVEDRLSYNDILVASEEAKISLTDTTSTKMRITHEGIRAAYTITRGQFEEMTKDLLEKTTMLTESVLEDQKLSWRGLQGVLLVGGSTRMPMVRDFMVARSGKEPITGVDVDEAVALGAAVQASKMVDERGGKKVFRLPGTKRLQDVTSHSLGKIALNKARDAYLNSIILHKNQPIPSEDTRPYKLRTSARGPNTMEVYITQGESELASQCAYIGRYVADDVPHASGGEAIVDVTYAYDQSGIVQVAARDRTTGQELATRKEPVPEDMSWVELPPEFGEERLPGRVAVCLCMDVSGSMTGKPLNEAQEAARRFISEMDLSSSSVGIVSFGSEANVNTKATQNAKQLMKAVDSLAISGSTNMSAGIETSHGQLAKCSKDEARFLVLFTDGAPDNKKKTREAARQCHADGVDIVTIGTSGAVREFLAELASTDEANVFAQSGELVQVFGTIAQQITEGGGKLRRL